MVFFTCSACGASLKKNQVEKHFNTKCRHCEYLTCIDCLKDFPGDTYISHTKCMTENERYGGQNYVPKVNKNENKQLQWVENIHKLLETTPSMDSDVKNLLQSIVNHENIPRKRTKFINFIKNINKRVNPTTVEKTWELFEEALKSNKAPPVTEDRISQNSKSNGDLNIEVANKEIKSEDSREKEKRDKKKIKKKSKKGDTTEESLNLSKEKSLLSKKAGKKRKREEKEINKENGGEDSKEAEATSENSSKKKKKCNSKKSKKKDSNDQSSEPLTEFKGSSFYETPSKKRKCEEIEEDTQSPPKKVGKFDWEGTLTILLTKKGGSLSIKKVKKKILAEYESQCGPSHKSHEDLLSKLDKKLNKNRKFKVLKGQVTLVSK
ncbi:cell growth-regulating nucleolar protein [Lepeophtheirus salmonis]|uniref:cell growth-regulating nucleolar protein n=1 Tax=Lepeophtheirus salmonis TaxID=72036 RepID=UPI001AEAFF04|nr:cell growth-regulating nucleolar protein-like [Lepeophtheirus salmonis]